MPFWTLFWLIVPAVLYLTVSVVFYRRTRNMDDTADSPRERRR